MTSKSPNPFVPVGPGGDVPAETPNGTARSSGQHPATREIAQPRLLNGTFTAKNWPGGNRTGE